MPSKSTKPIRAFDLHRYLDHFRARVLQDALNEATAEYWHRRADALEKARSRPNDYLGTRTTTQERRARDDGLAAAATACRRRASLTPLPAAPDPDVWAALHEQQTRSNHPDAA